VVAFFLGVQYEPPRRCLPSDYSRFIFYSKSQSCFLGPFLIFPFFGSRSVPILLHLSLTWTTEWSTSPPLPPTEFTTDFLLYSSDVRGNLPPGHPHVCYAAHGHVETCPVAPTTILVSFPRPCWAYSIPSKSTFRSHPALPGRDVKNVSVHDTAKYPPPLVYSCSPRHCRSFPSVFPSVSLHLSVIVFSIFKRRTPSLPS